VSRSEACEDRDGRAGGGYDAAAGDIEIMPVTLVELNVYYWRTWYKAVCGGKGGSEGHVLRDTTSRGLRGRV
jgi:hypothetical protein